TCVSASIYSQQSNVVAEELKAWQTQLYGPAPDVWVPESSVWIQQASNKENVQDMMPELQPSLARSPNVIAMPKTLAVALGWPNTNFDWPDIVTDMNKPNFWSSKVKGVGGTFKFTMTDPTSSTAGLLALMSVVDSSNDGFVDTTTGTGDEQPNIISLASAVRSQSDVGDTSDVTDGLSKADTTSAAAATSYVSAFPALEQDVIKYNERDPKEPLVAVYPKSGSYDADNPYLILNKPAWGKPQNVVAAQAFETFVRAPAARAAFLKAGFRDANRTGDATFTAANGVLRALPTNFLPRAVLDPASVHDTVLAFSAATKPTNVLIALDVSTSMSDVVPASGGKTRLQLAQAAATQALAQFDPQASVGLWQFSSNLDGTQPYQSLVPLGPIGATMSDGHTRKQDLGAAISGLTAKTGKQGNTGLYATIDAAQKSVVSNYTDATTNFVVIITDGHDDPQNTPGAPQTDLGQLEADLTHAHNTKTNVPVVTIGLSSEADTKDLASISRISGGVAYTSPTGFDIAQVLAAALFGQVNQD
ncbi:MAG TPA: substrate-binding domain-containing protein, partial [Micromonosporaceae bacterium]